MINSDMEQRENNGFLSSVQNFSGQTAQYCGELKIIIHEIYKMFCEMKTKYTNIKIKNHEDFISTKLFSSKDKSLLNSDRLTIDRDSGVTSEGCNQTRKPDITIRYISSNPYRREFSYYHIECKRLDGGSTLNKQYIYKDKIYRGLHRYLDDTEHDDGYYPVPTGITAMVGFIVKNDIDIKENTEKINKIIYETQEVYNVNIGQEQFLTPHSIITDYENTYLSKHQTHKNKRKISVYHLFLDFSSMII
jgi:hypothetical protein